MNLQLILSFLATIIFVIPNSVLGEQYCYAKNDTRPQTSHFSTLTIYDRARGPDTQFKKFFNLPECKPQKVWVMVRHGIRLPPVETIKSFPDLESIRQRILENINRKTTGLCIEDQYSFKTWKLNKSITVDNALYLTDSGREGLELMGSMYRTKILSNILPNEYDPKHYLLGYSNNERAEDSLRAFADGLFGKNNAMPKLQQNEKLIRPYASCEDFERNTESLDGPDSEVTKFKSSDIMKQTIKDVSDRLGFKGGLEFEEVRLIWDMCRYEEAWHPKISSAWCAAFTADNVNVLEYFEDLEGYYKAGYGYERGKNLACSALKDMINQLKDPNTDPRAIFYFGHSTIIELLLTAMGYKKDAEKLTGSNYSRMKNRQWKTSEISPFAGNFAVVKYTCPDEPKVMFFLNQVPITDLNWCAYDLCRWEDVLVNYDKILNQNCDHIYCYQSSSSTIKLSLSLILISCIYYLTFYF